MLFDGRHFALTVVSSQDAFTMELDDVTDGGRETVADVQILDADGRLTFTAFRRDLPLAAVEWLIASARVRLAPAPDAG